MHCSVQLICVVLQAKLVFALLQTHLSLHNIPNLVSHTHSPHRAAHCIIQYTAQYSTGAKDSVLTGGRPGLHNELPAAQTMHRLTVKLSQVIFYACYSKYSTACCCATQPTQLNMSGIAHAKTDIRHQREGVHLEASKHEQYVFCSPQMCYQCLFCVWLGLTCLTKSRLEALGSPVVTCV